jgi:hypothetical protein
MEQNIDSLDVSNVKEKKNHPPTGWFKKTFQLTLGTGSLTKNTFAAKVRTCSIALRNVGIAHQGIQLNH